MMNMGTNIYELARFVAPPRHGLLEAQPAQMGDECDCASCRSDMALIVPCLKAENDDN